MAEPVTFAVRRANGRDDFAIYYDHFPAELSRKLPADVKPALIYALRLDRLPDGHEWKHKNLDDLSKLYARDKAAGSLPPSNVADPPKAKVATTLALGARRARMTRPWGQLPPEPYPAPEGLVSRPEAAAFILRCAE